MKLNADQLRKYQRSTIEDQKAKIKKHEIYIILDNVLDTYNIGSIFRLADAVAAKKIYLCGGTETPPNHRIKKASINTAQWVDWEYCETAVEAIEKVKRLLGARRPSKNISQELNSPQIIAIEQSPKSIQYNKFEYKLPICLIIGHESNGVSKEVLKMCDAIVEIPMFGINISLNVMVSLGIVLYKVLEKVKTD